MLMEQRLKRKEERREELEEMPIWAHTNFEEDERKRREQEEVIAHKREEEEVAATRAKAKVVESNHKEQLPWCVEQSRKDWSKEVIEVPPNSYLYLEIAKRGFPNYWDEEYDDMDLNEEETHFQKFSSPYLFKYPGSQLLYVKIKECDVPADENGQVFVYGTIIGRDFDKKANYLFRRSIDHCVPMRLEETIPLTGPCRGMHSNVLVIYEFYLKVKSKRDSSKGKPLAVCNKGTDIAVMYKDEVYTKQVLGKYGQVEVKYAVFMHAAQAFVQVWPGSICREGLRGKIVARLRKPDWSHSEDDIPDENDISDNEIVLFDSEIFNEDFSYDQDVIKLWNSVLVVPRNRILRLKVDLNRCGGSWREEREISFTPKTKKPMKLRFTFGTVVAYVAWYPLWE